MDFIAKADNHNKKGKRARRHSNLWANVTCNLLSCEKHNWQQHCDFFFSGYRKTDKIGVELSPASVPRCCPPPSVDLEGLTHLRLPKGSCVIAQVRQKDCEGSVAGDGPFAPEESRLEQETRKYPLHLVSLHSCLEESTEMVTEKQMPGEWLGS